MASPDLIADARQRSLIETTTTATNRGLKLWRQMDFNALDASWSIIAPQLVAQATSAQAHVAQGADRFTSSLSAEYGFNAENSRIVPEAFAGVDGSGRSTESLLRGAVTTTKEAIGAGLGRIQSMEAGATFLAAMMKTAIADMGRSADMVSSAGKGYTQYVRVVEPGACSRCILLAGSTRFKPFKRHPACKCTCQPIPKSELDSTDRYSPGGVFDAMSEAEQNRAFSKAGAAAIREGADISQVVSARRGAAGIGYSHRMPTGSQFNRMKKTTIGVRPDGTAVRLYTTTEGTTVRGQFGRSQVGASGSTKLANDRYSKVNRVRLMPESIMEIAGDNTALRQAFLRDAGYLEYRPANGFDSANRWVKEIEEMRRNDRILVNQATLRYGNFTLG